MESFLGNFCRHLTTFYWSHCSLTYLKLDADSTSLLKAKMMIKTYLTYLTFDDWQRICALEKRFLHLCSLMHILKINFNHHLIENALWINVEEAKIPSYIKLLFVRSRGPWTSMAVKQTLKYASLVRLMILYLQTYTIKIYWYTSRFAFSSKNHQVLKIIEKTARTTSQL